MKNNIKLKAVIDLGSLKAKFSVFNTVDMSLVFQKSYLTLLGKGISENKIIVDEALEKLRAALLEIKDELKKIGCSDVVIIATESLRIAINKEDVFVIVDGIFPGISVTILNQEMEGEMFFKTVSQAFLNTPIVAIDIGGGSVQIFYGIYNSSEAKHSVIEKQLHKTGTYKLQQKYSPDNDVISDNFNLAIIEILNEYEKLNIKSDILVFGSTCMKDFIEESGIQIHSDRPFKNHNFYVKKESLMNLLSEIRKFPPSQRKHIYPSGDYFIYGADYLLINLIEIMNKTGAVYIYPTNLNSSYGFIT